MSKELKSVDYLYILMKWRKFIVVTCFTVAVIVTIMSLIVPHTYTAKATILPPSEENMGLGITSLLKNIPTIGGLAGGMLQNDIYIYMAILNSRTVYESIVNEFNLINVYKTKNMEETIKQLKDMLDVTLNDEGTLSISAAANTVWFPGKSNCDSARQKAARMTNFWLNQLDLLNQQLRNEKAVEYRKFIELRYLQNLDDLKIAEDALNEFQNEYGVVDIPQQTKTTLIALSELRAQVIAKDVEAQALNNLYSSNHTLLKKSRMELKVLKKELNKLMQDRDQELNFENDILLNFENIPELGLEYARLYREVLLQQTLLEFILPQYEQAKLQEAKNTSTVQVLDHAVPPVLRSKPKRAITILLVTFVVLILCVSFVFTIEHFQHMSDEESRRKWSEIFGMLQNDLRSFRRK